MLVPDERSFAVAHVLCQPPTHYDRVMTRTNRMPLLIGERI